MPLRDRKQVHRVSAGEWGGTKCFNGAAWAILTCVTSLYKTFQLFNQLKIPRKKNSRIRTLPKISDPPCYSLTKMNSIATRNWVLCLSGRSRDRIGLVYVQSSGSVFWGDQGSFLHQVRCQSSPPQRDHHTLLQTAFTRWSLSSDSWGFPRYCCSSACKIRIEKGTMEPRIKIKVESVCLL